jgi:GNAT superfamily N-acetyltransferase
MTVEVRPAGPADHATLWPMLQELHRHEGVVPGPAQSAALRRLLAEPAFGRVLLARGGGQALGYAAVVRGYSIEFGGPDAFLDELFVAEAARSKGVGGRLLDAAEAYCRGEGIVALHLEVGDGNPRARDLYARRGFAAHDRRLMTLRIG